MPRDDIEDLSQNEDKRDQKLVEVEDNKKELSQGKHRKGEELS